MTIEYAPEKTRLDQLLLDPNNYRFLDMNQYTEAQPNRVHEVSVQQRAEDLVKLDGREELRALKERLCRTRNIGNKALPVQEGYVLGCGG